MDPGAPRFAEPGAAQAPRRVVRAEAGPEAEQLWKDWFRGARFWLKALTAGEPLSAQPLRVETAPVTGGEAEG